MLATPYAPKRQVKLMSDEILAIISIDSQVIEFGGDNIDFDTDSYNAMTQLLNNVKQFYRHG